jgi:hypothetical protein
VLEASFAARASTLLAGWVELTRTDRREQGAGTEAGSNGTLRVRSGTDDVPEEEKHAFQG